MKTPTHFGARLQAATLGLAGSVILAATASAQVVNYTAGDLLLGFRAASGAGSETTFVYNVGSTIGFRDGTTNGTLANVGSFLSSVYGADWFTRSDVSWGAIGVRNSLNPNVSFNVPPVVNGDPASTLYVSKGTLTPGASSAWVFPANAAGTGSTTIVSASNAAVTFQSAGGSAVSGSFNKQTAAQGSDGFGAFVPAAANNSWSTFTFGPGADFNTFPGGIEQTFGTGEEFAYVDLYRLLARTNQSGSVILDGNITAGTGSYITTLAINADGVVSVIPEPSSFAAIGGAFALMAVAARRKRRA